MKIILDVREGDFSVLQGSTTYPRVRLDPVLSGSGEDESRTGGKVVPSRSPGSDNVVVALPVDVSKGRDLLPESRPLLRLAHPTPSPNPSVGGETC